MVIDYLERQEFVDTLIKIVQQLAENHKGCTFAINGRWGCGKTFVLDRFEEQVSIFQDPNAAGDKYFVLRYNCWQYDYYEEPAVAIVAAMLDAVRERSRILSEPSEGIKAFFSTVLDVGENMLDQIISEKFGFSPSEIKDMLIRNKTRIHHQKKTAHEYDSYYSFKQQLTILGDSLSKLAKEKPIIVLVDELDRCMPAYAITVLERLHHIFREQHNIITILAIDQERLANSITEIYGIKEDELISDYLKKFISFSLSLDAGKISNLFWDKYRSYYDLFDITEKDADLSQTLPINLLEGIDVRTQEKIMERILLLHQLSFTPSIKYPVSVMFFELLHQVLAYRCRSFNITAESCLINLQGMHRKLGESLFTYLCTLESSAIETSQVPTVRGTEHHRFLRDTELSTSFRWFAQIKNLNKMDIENPIEPYHTHSIFASIPELPQEIKLFASLASKMEYK